MYSLHLKEILIYEHVIACKKSRKKKEGLINLPLLQGIETHFVSTAIQLK